MRRLKAILGGLTMFLVFLTAFSACAGPSAAVIKKTPVAPENWPSTTMTLADFTAYFDGQGELLDPLEGIWSLSSTTKWVNVISGLKGDTNHSNIYKIAIMKDATDPTLFNAWIIDSDYAIWVPGLLKAQYAGTAMANVYQEKWYLSNFSEENKIITLQKNALIRTVDTAAEYPINYEKETIKLKLYPSAKSVQEMPKAETEEH